VKRKESDKPLQPLAHMVIHGCLQLLAMIISTTPIAEQMKSLERQLTGATGICRFLTKPGRLHPCSNEYKEP